MNPPKKQDSSYWENEYRQLKKRYTDETEYLLNRIKDLEARVNATDMAMESLVYYESSNN